MDSISTLIFVTGQCSKSTNHIIIRLNALNFPVLAYHLCRPDILHKDGLHDDFQVELSVESEFGINLFANKDCPIFACNRKHLIVNSRLGENESSQMLDE